MKRAFLLIALMIGTHGFSQHRISARAKSAERRWAVRHPFIANRCLKLTKEALNVSTAARGTFGLDTALAEGTFDAFRHGYWMARLAQKFAIEKVLELGEAHEESNYRSFLVKEREHGVIPDKTSSDMDLWNNKVGAEIGAKNKDASPEVLKKLILDAILRGEFRIVKKSASGAYLDCEGNAIPPQKIQGTWENPKCLVPSNFR